ncbi:MAG TPA: hypothetical protein VGL60_09975, partial [Acidimicrobiales bacterium]
MSGERSAAPGGDPSAAGTGGLSAAGTAARRGPGPLGPFIVPPAIEDSGELAPGRLGGRSPVRLVLGLACGLGSLVVPWVGLSLTPSPKAWDLHLSVAAVPLVGHLTYGVLVLALLVV